MSSAAPEPAGSRPQDRAACGAGERRAVRALLRLSERPTGGRGRAPGGGWEEAVHGWGNTDPLACFQLQKQVKKSKANEPATSCLLCLEMLASTDRSSGQEIKTTRHQSRSENKLSADGKGDAASEKEVTLIHSSKSECCSTTHGVKTDIGNRKARSVGTCQGENKNMPLKACCMWNLQAVKSPEDTKHKLITPEALDVLDPNESLTSRSPQILPPVKAAPPKDSSDPPWKNKKGTISQKMLDGTSAEIASCSHDAKGTEQKGKRGTDIMNDKTRENTAIQEPSSVFSSHTEASLLQTDPEQLSWDCALTPDTSVVTISNPVASKKSSQHACMQVPNTNRTAYTTHDVQGSLTWNRYVEVEEENKSEIEVVSLLSGLSPSAKASHAARAALPSRLN